VRYDVQQEKRRGAWRVFIGWGSLVEGGVGERWREVIGGERGKRPPSFLRLATKDFG
jgi:hypothetical protein